MTALYFQMLKPEGRVAVKPHASPIFHAIQYLMGNQTQRNMQKFRGYGGVQSYPSRTKDIDDDFSTGSFGLGVAVTSFASIVQDYIQAKWEFTPEGQHIELGLVEMTLFLLLAAGGLSHSIFGKRLMPIGIVYDPFVSRGLDALNYACYQDARVMNVGTPSEVTLAPESGAQQSIASPLIGISQDGLAAFEPAFADELAVILEWAFSCTQKW